MVGPAVLSIGFRPFFLAASLFAVVVVPVWWMVWTGAWTLQSPFQPLDWHIHEMIFGYAAAVIAGFLFTAVPNWSGRKPTRGWPLVGLFALWVIGRVAVAGLLPLGAFGVAIVDCAFLLVIGAMVLFEIVAARNWRNLIVVVPIGLLCVANITFHAEAIGAGQADIGRRLGLAVILFLITLIGGRIIPSFTRNWLAKQGVTDMPKPFGRFDLGAIVAGGAALIAWVAQPSVSFSGALLALAGLLHFVRLSRWRGTAVLRSPLLLMLHIAYGFLPAGLLLTSAAAFGKIPPAAGLHLLGIGAVGGMTVAVMMRATLGHTNRPLVAGPGLTLAFTLICGAAVVRAVLSEIAIMNIDGIAIAALFWTLGFGILCVQLVPWLVMPSVNQKASPEPKPVQ